MEDNQQARARRRIPAGFVGMLALVLVTETIVIQRGTGLGSALAWLWNDCGRAAAKNSKECQVLCLGDSQVKHGMITNVLEDRLKLRTMNLAFSGGQAPTSYFQLRRVLNAGAKPAAVVVDFYPILLSHGLEENTYRWAEYLTTAECLDLARTAGDANMFAWVMTGRLFPSVRCRQGLRELVISRLKGEKENLTDRIHVFRRNTWKNRGALIFEKNPTCWLPKDLDAWVRSGFLPDRVGNDCNMSYVNRFLKLAAQHAIPVFWIIPPDHPTIEARKSLEGINARYTRLIQRSLVKFPNLTVLDARRSSYPANVFYDQSHLDREGAATLSSDVANAIGNQLKGQTTTRLVDLPVFRAVEPNVPIEDTLETFFVMRNIEDQRRR